MDIQPDKSWLAGSWSVDGRKLNNSGNPECYYAIDTGIPYVAIGEYYWQGDEADKVIDEIHCIWLKGMSEIESIQEWENMYL